MTTAEWIKKNSEFFTDRDIRYVVTTLVEGAQEIDRHQQIALDAIVNAHRQGMPVAYLLGKEEFMGREFVVTPDVLIPRPETELIVEAALRYISQGSCRVLDLCCGSGVIGICVKQARPQAHVTLVDISARALGIARRNARIHQPDVVCIESDGFMSLHGQTFDIIISNPPYVAARDITGTLAYEPRIALDGGIDGMDVLARVIAQAPVYLKEGGILVMEMGFDQKEKVQACVEQTNSYEIIEWLKDYAGHWRGGIFKKRNV